MTNSQPKPGQSVSLNGAGGGVGSIAIQLLKLHDLDVTGVDSAAKLEAMRSWGFDHVIDYKTDDFTRNGQAYDLIIDAKTDRSPADYERALNPNGVYATVGGRSSALLGIALSGLRIGHPQDKRLRVIGLQTNHDLAYFNELFETGLFKPIIDTHPSWQDPFESIMNQHPIMSRRVVIDGISFTLIEPHQ